MIARCPSSAQLHSTLIVEIQALDNYSESSTGLAMSEIQNKDSAVSDAEWVTYVTIPQCILFKYARCAI